jgi:glycosyltransferase involved in cell wall biosynthesis
MNPIPKKNKTMARVLMLTTSFPLAKNSFSGIFIYHLAMHFPKHIRLTVLVPGADHLLKKKIKDNCKVICFRYAPLGWQILTHKPGGLPEAIKNNRNLLFLLPFFFLSMLISCIRMAKKADVIHANWGINGAIAGIAGYLTKTPVITTLRGTDVKRFHNSWIDRFLIKICFATNKRIVSVNHSISMSMIKFFPQWVDKFVTISNGVSPAFLNVQSIHRQPGSMLRLITIGSLIEGKGIHTIIKAISQLNAPQNIQLTIIGDGPERVSLNRLAVCLDVSEQVKFQGQVPHWRIPEFLTESHGLILASFSEGRPNVVLEAMAAGLPVIASDIEGTRELIEDEKNGLFFKPGNADQLCLQIKKLKNNPEFGYQLGQAGRKFILENNLVWEKTAGLYSNLYREMIPCAD